MLRPRITLMVVLLALPATLLTSCSTDPTAVTTSREADKGAPPPPRLIDPRFLGSVVDAYESVTWVSVPVRVNLAGCQVRVIPPDWPQDRFIEVTIPANSQYRGEHLFQIEVPKFDTGPVKIPGDVTMYLFRNLPKLKTISIEMVMPPAPWYPGDLLDGPCSVYQIVENSNGGWTATNLQSVEGEYNIESATFYLQGAIDLSKPDNPARLLLESGEPGEPGSGG